MGKLAPSAAWPETLTALGTALSAPDTFLLPRGRSVDTFNTPLYLSSVGFAEPAWLFSATSCLFFCNNSIVCSRTWELLTHRRCDVGLKLLGCIFLDVQINVTSVPDLH